MRRGERGMSKWGGGGGDRASHMQVKESVRMRRVIPQAALRGPALYRLVFHSPSDSYLRARGLPAQRTEYTQEQSFLWQSGMHEGRD